MLKIDFSEIAPAEYEEEECIGGMHHGHRVCKTYADQTF